MDSYIFDIEVYPNYALVLFKNINNFKFIKIELLKDKLISDIIYNNILKLIEKSYLIGFNCVNYDQVILKSLLNRNISNKYIYETSYEIIKNNKMYWEFNYDSDIKLNLIDLFKISPAMCGLKMQGARINSNKIDELPFKPNTNLDLKYKVDLISYCKNDIEITENLYNYLKPQIDLRFKIMSKYNVKDLLIKSDPQIAEVLLLKDMGYHSKPKNIPPDILCCDIPKWIHFNNSVLRNKNNTDLNYFLNELKNNLNIKMLADDFNIKKTIKLDGMYYQFGIGGLHSKEASRSIIPDFDECLIEYDVSSLYPSIIINEEISPSHMGYDFLVSYKKFYNERINAKKSGDKVTSDVLKLVLNGTFGKFDNKYSSIYSTNCLLKTTITGQLALLMLINMLGEAFIKVVSANTDSVTILFKKYKFPIVNKIINNWQNISKLKLESTVFKGLYSHSVNNYIALTEDSYKAKGRYVKGSLRNNLKSNILIDAVVNFIREGTPLLYTIKNCDYIKDYLLIGYSKEGIIWDGNNLGKCIRYYLSKSGKTAYISKNKKDGSKFKLPDGDKIKPIKSLEFFNDKSDIDFQQYYDKCLRILSDIGFSNDIRKKPRKKVREICTQLELDLH